MIIKNGKVIINNELVKKDILIKDDLIVDVEDEINELDEEIIDATDCLIMPGGVDVHVHLRQPGFEYKETIKSGTHAAAKGGITTIMSMPNLNPCPDSVNNLNIQKKIIEKYESLIRGLYQFLFQQAKYDHFVSLGDISQISNGNSDVKDASMYNDGSLYPFFDRSDEIKFLPEYLFDKEAIIYPGEGAEFYPRHYNGKFALHQRCYAVYDISTDFIPRYLYHYCKEH